MSTTCTGPERKCSLQWLFLQSAQHQRRISSTHPWCTGHNRKYPICQRCNVFNVKGGNFVHITTGEFPSLGQSPPEMVQTTCLNFHQNYHYRTGFPLKFVKNKGHTLVRNEKKWKRSIQTSSSMRRGQLKELLGDLKFIDMLFVCDE